MVKIAVFVSGGGTNLQALIDASERGDIDSDIALVVSNNENSYALMRAENHNIPNFVSRKDDEILDLLEEYEIDWVVLAGYLRTIPESMIEAFPNRIINIHPSLIPAFAGQGFYGMKVHEAAIKRGVQFSGVTVHIVNEELDEGPILKQEIVEVGPNDTAEDLQKKVLEVEHRILVNTIKMIEMEWEA